MIRDKKGQIRMTETIAVLFIFFVLILFGIIFYYKYQQVSFKEKQEELLATRAMENTLKTLFLPELQCSRGDAEPEDNCVDLMKLEALNGNGVIQKYANEYYFNIFSFATITVDQLYPSKKGFVVYNKTKPEWERRESTYFFVTLRDQRAADGEYTYNHGFLRVEVFS